MAELTDGRILVIEYKGEAYATNDDSKEKNSIGQLWEEKSNGKALFLFALKADSKPLQLLSPSPDPFYEFSRYVSVFFTVYLAAKRGALERTAAQIEGKGHQYVELPLRERHANQA